MKLSVWKRLRAWRGIIVSVVVFAALLIGMVALVGGVEGKSEDNQLDIVKSAVRRAALTCYAVEGRYPQTIDYLNDHYGLLYDAERYTVVYDAFASNIIPDISVLIGSPSDAFEGVYIE